MDISDTKDIRAPRNECNVTNENISEISGAHATAAERRAWILQQLKSGVRLKVPNVMSQFNGARRTAQRNLDDLRNIGTIEFLGDAGADYYRSYPTPPLDP